MNTIATSSAMARISRPMSSGVPFSALSRAPAPGNELTTEAKMSSDMPLPMPRWLISSPIHISRAWPAVRVSTTMITRNGVNTGRTSTPVELPPPPSRPPPPLWKRKARPVDCSSAMATAR